MITTEEDYRDLCTMMTWYEHIPERWKDPAVCRDSKAFARIREMCRDYSNPRGAAGESVMTCTTCVHWDRTDRVGRRRMSSQPDSLGREEVHACMLTESADDQPTGDAWASMAVAGILTGGYAGGDAVLWTSEAFGCNQWQAASPGVIDGSVASDEPVDSTLESQ